MLSDKEVRERAEAEYLKIYQKWSKVDNSKTLKILDKLIGEKSKDYGINLSKKIE